jgi:molecular chaperone GrpE (heat shock protein)
MANIFFENLNIINFFAILILIVLFAVFLFLYMRRYRQENLSSKLAELYSKIKNDINFAVAPNSINLAPSTDDFIQFAIEIWRIEQRISKLTETLPENQRKGLENSAQKFKRYLEKYDIEIVDYTNQKFNDGLNLDVLSVEKDPSVPESIVKETVEPTIMYRGQVIKKAKIIVLSMLN